MLGSSRKQTIHLFEKLCGAKAEKEKILSKEYRTCGKKIDMNNANIDPAKKKENIDKLT